MDVPFRNDSTKIVISMRGDHWQTNHKYVQTFIRGILHDTPSSLSLPISSIARFCIGRVDILSHHRLVDATCGYVTGYECTMFVAD